MQRLLIMSIVGSVVLTVLANLALRTLPGSRRRLGDKIQELVERPEPHERPSGSRVQVVFPWKLMLIGSLVLTALVNLLLVTFLIPVSAILLGTLFLGETLLPRHFAGMALIGAGLAAIDGRLGRATIIHRKGTV